MLGVHFGVDFPDSFDVIVVAYLEMECLLEATSPSMLSLSKISSLGGLKKV